MIAFSLLSWVALLRLVAPELSGAAFQHYNVSKSHRSSASPLAMHLLHITSLRIVGAIGFKLRTCARRFSGMYTHPRTSPLIANSSLSTILSSSSRLPYLGILIDQRTLRAFGDNVIAARHPLLSLLTPLTPCLLCAFFNRNAKLAQDRSDGLSAIVGMIPDPEADSSLDHRPPEKAIPLTTEPSLNPDATVGQGTLALLLSRVTTPKRDPAITH